jgi:MoxR-like ATPase
VNAPTTDLAPGPEAADALLGEIEALGASLQTVRTHIGQVIFGQQEVVEQTLVTLLAGGHLLLIGVPGLAKTKLVETLGTVLGLDAKRVQCTPDLMPADIIGSEVLEEGDSGKRQFRFLQGPVFAQILMADEINRAPAKVQAALLEAMAERQITVGKATYPLPPLFMVMATQNPIEQEGTYPLPEAQLDRFLLHVKIDYPNAEHEQAILHLARAEAKGALHSQGGVQPKVSQQALFAARGEVLDLYLAESLEQYLLQIVLATRNPGVDGPDLAGWIQYGASPRASIALDRCARAKAWLQQRDFVDPGDIQDMAYDVLRHRLILSYEAEAEGISSDYVIKELIARIAVP